MANDQPASIGAGDNESKFLAAIEKFAQRQRETLLTETEIFEQKVLQQAEEEGLRDAYKLIHKEQDAMRAAIAADMAKKEAQGKLEIFKKRQQITEEVFTKAANKLKKYTDTPEYEKKLTAYARECAEYFGDDKVELCVCKKDIELGKRLAKCFKGECTVKEVLDITVGGFRVNCPSRKIAVDKTLDTRLEEQREWFYTNADLNVR